MIKLKEVIALVGKKRFLALVFFLIATAASVFLWMQVLLPQNQTLTNELAALDAERNRLQQEIADLPARYAALIESEKKLEIIVKKGFYQAQDRILSRAKLDELRVSSGLRGISYDIAPQEIIDYPQLVPFNKKLVRSKITVEFKSLSDLEIRDFIKKMLDDFSGLVILEQVKLEQASVVDQQNLSNLSKKIPVDFVKGQAVFYWYSVLDKPAEEANPQLQAFGGQV